MILEFTQSLVDNNKIVGNKGFLDPAIFVSKQRQSLPRVPNINASIYKLDEIIYVEFYDIPKSKEILKIEDMYGPFVYKTIFKREYLQDELDDIIQDAIKLRATDIHFEPKEDGMRVRFRVDGVMTQVFYFKNNFNRISNIIKVRSGMDTVNKEIQDGSMELSNVNIRVSSVPTQYGEKFVLRLLNTNQVELDLIKLGMSRKTTEKYVKLIKKEGMNLVVGPTGSGKNTTLHAALRELQRDEKNIISIEDPIEYRDADITQLEVDNSRGRTFNKLLRASLRQDPDIIYIGEIRDEETARVAMRAAITGHTVFSTLHTRGDYDTYDRLLDLGVEEYILKSGISTIISQRLVRTLCDCKVRGNDGHYYANGCEKCIRGYRGRIGVFELSVPEKERGDFKFNKIVQYEGSLNLLYENGFIDFITYEEANDL